MVIVIRCHMVIWCLYCHTYDSLFTLTTDCHATLCTVVCTYYQTCPLRSNRSFVFFLTFWKYTDIHVRVDELLIQKLLSESQKFIPILTSYLFLNIYCTAVLLLWTTAVTACSGKLLFYCIFSSYDETMCHIAPYRQVQCPSVEMPLVQALVWYCYFLPCISEVCTLILVHSYTCSHVGLQNKSWCDHDFFCSFNCCSLYSCHSL